MSEAKLFYSKCRPQDSDAWPVAQQAKRVFVGYPVRVSMRRSGDWRTQGCQALFRDLRDPDWRENWTSSLARSYRAQVSLNRRLANVIGEGSIVLVPRLGEGTCHAGTVAGGFELVDRPDWAEEYFELRKEAGLEVHREIEHVGDIAQTWPVKSWVALPFATLPRWISYRLLSRNTAGIIEDLVEAKTTGVDAVKRLMTRPGRYWTIGSKNLEEDLLTWLSPRTFEHLIISLLQLEADRSTFWHHVGGSGDGGVDGVAISRRGNLKALLQCKWHYDGAIGELMQSLQTHGVRSVVAVLHGTQTAMKPLQRNQEFWNRKKIAALVKKHKERLPLAGSLGLWNTS